MTAIYIDESGYTGDDLYNPEQPHFVIASSLVGDEEAQEILRSAFPRYQGPEFKFTNIWRRQTSRDALRTFAEKIPSIAERVYLYIIDKRFSLIVKMFDYLVEPSFYAGGFDYYAGGYARRYMNTVHRDLLRYGSEALYDETAKHWDAFARTPNRKTLLALRHHLDRTAAQSEHPISTIFNMLAEGSRRFEASNPRLKAFENTSEVQLTAVLSSVVYWRQQRLEDFDIVHDESSNFLRQREVWDTILRDDCVAGPVEQANGTMVDFPLRARTTRAVRSHDSAAVQLCDVLAGLGGKVALSFEKIEKDPFILDLVVRGAGELTTSGVRPHKDYAVGGVPRRTGPDMVDQMVDLLQPYFHRRAAAQNAESD